jgi:hypothetical protein
MTKHILRLLLLLLAVAVPCAAAAQLPAAPEAQRGSVSGVVVDTDDAAIPHATVTVEGPAADDKHTATADDSGYFRVPGLKAGVSYKVSVTAVGFGTASLTGVQVSPGQQLTLNDMKLKPASDVTVTAETTQEAALEEEKVEEHQRVLGVIPNFYVEYDRQDVVPMPAMLKFKLALKASTDTVSLVAAGFLAGLDQASRSPHYVEGAKGYGQRIGAAYADGASDILIGGAILPTLLRQDPRYYYQGTGTKKSRFLHAVSSPVICKGDNGHTQFNLSSVGGDLISGALSETYYPPIDRGPALVFNSALIITGGRVANALLQEFVLSKFTTHKH